MPIDKRISALCDKGMVENIQAEWLVELADAIIK